MITACPRPCAWRSYALGLGLLPLAAQAEFLADSSAHLDLRNFYQLRDYRQHDAPQSQAGNWSQGFVLRLQSGFTAARSASAWMLPGCSASSSTRDAGVATMARCRSERIRRSRWTTTVTSA